jgi:hypothetical protein
MEHSKHYNDPERNHPLRRSTDKSAKLNDTMDAKLWADEYCRLNTAADHATMLSWFANAIMAGYDEANRRHATASTRADTTIAFDEWIAKTDWVQEHKDSFSFNTLSMHRADVLRREIETLRAKVDHMQKDLSKIRRQTTEQISRFVEQHTANHGIASSTLATCANSIREIVWHGDDIDIGAVGKANKSIEPVPTSAALVDKKRWGAVDATDWKPITAPGQAKVGDTLWFKLAGLEYTAVIKQVLEPGTPNEELVYDNVHNYYIITLMAVAGTSQHKEVRLGSKVKQ